jgi:hypothetical protein
MRGILGSWIGPASATIVIWAVAAPSVLLACSASDSSAAENDRDQRPRAETDSPARDAAVPQPGADDPNARPWAYAGSWFEEDPAERAETITEMLDSVELAEGEPRDAVALIAPHAKISASGPTAAQAYARVTPPTRVIMLASDHSEEGPPISIWEEGPWLLPGVAFETDEEATARLMELLPDLEPSRDAFDDHEIELHLPFLEQLNPELELVSLAFHDNSRSHFENFDPQRIDDFGAAIAELYSELSDEGERVLLVASVDMTHHEPLSDVERKDEKLTEYITTLNVDGLFEYVTEKEISICSEVPAALLMAALSHLGYDSIEEVSRGNSLHSSMDEQDVVGYLAAIAWE